MTFSKKHFIFLFLLFIPLIFSTSYGFKSGKPKGVYHRVKKGETLFSIAKAYSVHVQDLAEVNNIENLNLVEVDQVLFVPSADEVIEDVMLQMRTQDSASIRKKPAGKEASLVKIPPGRGALPATKQTSESGMPSGASPQKTSTPPSETSTGEISEMPKEGAAPKEREELPVKESPSIHLPAPAKSGTGSLNKKEEFPTEIQGKLQLDKKRFIWPVKGRVISRFGVQPNKMYHNWISISAKEMTPVVAAASGTVIFSSELKDYGETIIIKHTDGFATVYTHLKVRKVQLDESVKKGEPIALVGKIGQEDKTYLNFEVRHQNRARNPLFFLP